MWRARCRGGPAPPYSRVLLRQDFLPESPGISWNVGRCVKSQFRVHVSVFLTSPSSAQGRTEGPSRFAGRDTASGRLAHPLYRRLPVGGGASPILSNIRWRMSACVSHLSGGRNCLPPSSELSRPHFTPGVLGFHAGVSRRTQVLPIYSAFPREVGAPLPLRDFSGIIFWMTCLFSGLSLYQWGSAGPSLNLCAFSRICPSS